MWPLTWRVMMTVATLTRALVGLGSRALDGFREMEGFGERRESADVAQMGYAALRELMRLACFAPPAGTAQAVEGTRLAHAERPSREGSCRDGCALV